MREYIQDKFYEVLYHKISIADFEEWIYSTLTLEKDMASDKYFKLISLNYRDRHILHELEKLLEEDSLFKFEIRELLEALQSIIVRSDGYQHNIEEMYDFYCYQYPFLRKLGMDYGYYLIDCNDKKKLIDGFYPDIVKHAENMFAWIKNGKIVIKNIKDSLDWYEYDDFRTLAEKQIDKSDWD